MRKWHRWLSVFFALFMLWIAVTGVLSQLSAWWPAAELTAEQIAIQTPPAGWACPEGWRCIPPRVDAGFSSLVGLFHHLHSGSEFGPAGEAISFLSGFALIFFSVSGIWLYVQMWRNRKSRGLKKGLFWK